MSKGLKPCPFCGSEAIFWTVSNKATNSSAGVQFKIKCEKCGTEYPKIYECEMYLDTDGNISTGKDERAQAAADWNKRADDKNIPL